MELSGLAASIIISFSASFIFAYLLFWFDRYEKEPFGLLAGVFLWGAILSAGGAFLINTVLGLGVYVFTGSEAATGLTTSAVIAPFIEEILKGFAVLLVFFVFRQHFDSILDGIVYAGVAALGFAATENAYCIYTYGFLEEGWAGFWDLALVRIVLVGWQHPFYTAFFGIGLAVSRLNKNTLIKVAAPLAGLILAMASHAIHNTLSSLLSGVGGIAFIMFFDWTGWLLMLAFIIIISRVERRDLQFYLSNEVEAGTLTAAQFETAISAVKVSQARMAALFHGSYHTTNLFYRTTGRLAIKKKLLDRLGDEDGNYETVLHLREQARALSQSLSNPN